MYCPNCGAKMPSEAKFCTDCGTKLQINDDTIPDVETTIIDYQTQKKKKKRISPVVVVLLVIAVIDVLFSNFLPSHLYVYSSKCK